VIWHSGCLGERPGIGVCGHETSDWYVVQRMQEFPQKPAPTENPFANLDMRLSAWECAPPVNIVKRFLGLCPFHGCLVCAEL
jgi:hypothetical protein